MTAAPPCPCFADPFASTCGVWADNTSLCVCADLGIAHESGLAAPS